MNAEMRLQLLSICGGDLYRAKAAEAWLKNGIADRCQPEPFPDLERAKGKWHAAKAKALSRKP